MIRSLLVAVLLLPLAARAQPIPPSTTPVPSLALPGGYKAGRFYGAILPGNPTNAALGAANTLYSTPFFVAAPSTLKSLSFDIGTGNAAAWNARMCVYADNGSGLPGTLVPSADTGTVAIGSGSVTGVQTATVNGSTGVVLGGPAWYWLAFMADSSSESVFSTNGSALNAQRLFGDSLSTGIFAGVVNNGVSGAQTFGACPTTYPSPAVARNVVIPYVEAGF